MKKSVVLAILGLGLAQFATTQVHAQGGISIGSYKAPFNPVLWAGGGRVHSDQGVSLALWFGQGTLTADALTQSVALNWNTGAEGAGYFGYYGPVTAVLNGWTAGETWTFQVRASGTTALGAVDQIASRSALFFENANIQSIAGDPPGLPGISTQSIGLTVSVPEPSTMALAGLGAAALMMYRRRS